MLTKEQETTLAAMADAEIARQELAALQEAKADELKTVNETYTASVRAVESAYDPQIKAAQEKIVAVAVVAEKEA